MNEEDEKIIDETLKAIELWDSEIEEYKKKIEVVLKKKSDLVGELMKLCKPSFKRGESWYIIKTIRKTGTNTITKMDKEPGSWLRKNKDAQAE